MLSKRLVTAFCLLFISLFLLLSCTATAVPARLLKTSFYIYRFNPPALIEFAEDLQATGEIPFSIPPHCGLFNVFPSPRGKFMAIELSCPNGQTVLFLNTDSASVTQPIVDSDSHFLAWAPDGQSIYLKADSLGAPHVVRAYTDGAKDRVPILEFTYELASSINQSEFTFTLSRGLGQGSEMYLSERDGRSSQPLYADPYHYISFARFSPDGTQIAFLKTPDTQTPFTVGELWLIDRDGSNAHKLADADAGHGYAANWSPDGKRIAFVVRENSEDKSADQLSNRLISNIYTVGLDTGTLTQITFLEDGRAETPSWSPDGNTLAFNVVINDRIDVRVAEITTGEIRSLVPESTCCAAWMRK